MGKRPGSVNRPFEVLREWVDGGKIALQPDTDKPITPPKNIDAGLTDEQAFRVAMADGTVSLLGWSKSPVQLPGPFEIPAWADCEAEALRELESFVAGHGEMDPFAMGEGIEGASSAGARRFLPRLKQGSFSVQDQLDLHGLSLTDARPLLEGFLRRSRHHGYSCVRVIHGRGKHSPSEPHVMKRALTRWLGARKLRNVVVAYASARWRDGGSGAVYVLLFTGAR